MTLQDPEDQRLDVSLQAEPGAPQEARRRVGEIGQLSGHPDLCFIAQLLAGELVANVVRHARMSRGESFRLGAECGSRTLRVEVVDCGACYDPLAALRVHKNEKDGHRGVALVDALADCWGYRRRRRECCVWFELALVPGRRPWQGREPVR